MAAITLQRLRQIIEIAYDAGYHGCLDLKDVYADEIVQKLLDNSTEPILSKNDGWKIYKIKELRMVNGGTMFEHIFRGRGYIETHGVERVMRWMDGTISKFYADETPWTDPMRSLGMTMKNPSREPPKKKIRDYAALIGEPLSR